MTIPFTNNPSDKFTITIGDISYSIAVRWNTLYGFWTIDITSNDFTVLGVKIVSGINILRAFPDAPFALKSNDVLDPQRFNLDLYKLEII